MWTTCSDALRRTWPTVDGRHTLGLRMSAIDSGHLADRVYAFARQVGLARILVVKGKASCPTILGVPWRAEARRRRGLVIYPVGTNTAKAEFYQALRLTALPGVPLPAGYISLPQLATCHFIEHGENLLILGPPGVGKAHLAVGLGLKAIEHGYRVLFTTAAAMIAKLTAALAEGKLEEKLKLFTVPRLLLIDEIG